MPVALRCIVHHVVRDSGDTVSIHGGIKGEVTGQIASQPIPRSRSHSLLTLFL